MRVPAGLANKNVLLLDPQNIRLKAIPGYDSPKYDIRSDRIIRVMASGNLEVEEKVLFHGYLSGIMRQYLRDYTTTQRNAELESRLATGGRRINLEHAVVLNLDPAVGPVAITLRYQVQGALHRSGKNLVGKIPAPWEDLFLEPSTAPNRKTPFEVKTPMTVLTNLTVEAADSLGRPSVVNAQTARKGVFGRSGAKITNEGTRGLRIQAVFQRSPGEFPADKYSEYRSVVQSAQDLLGPSVQVPFENLSH